MCLPALALAAIATGVGGALQYAGGQQAKNAGLSALHSEQARQKTLTDQQQVDLDSSNASVKKLQDPTAQNAAVDARKAAFIAALNSAPAGQGSLPGQSAAPQVVQDAARKSAATQTDYSANQAGSLAKLDGFNDQMLGTNIQLGRNSADIGQLATTKANSANVLQSELHAATFKGGTLRGLGQLAQMVGAAAAGGAFAPGAAAAAPAAVTSTIAGDAPYWASLGSLGSSGMSGFDAFAKSLLPAVS